MNKSKEKNRNKFNTRIVSLLAKKHGFSNRYIKLILTGDRSPVVADSIKKEYKLLQALIDKEIKKVIIPFCK